MDEVQVCNLARKNCYMHKHGLTERKKNVYEKIKQKLISNINIRNTWYPYHVRMLKKKLGIIWLSIQSSFTYSISLWVLFWSIHYMNSTEETKYAKFWIHLTLREVQI